MPIDPVVLLAEQLKAAEQALRMLSRLDAEKCRQERAQTIDAVVQKIKRLCNALGETAPTSAMGAAELTRMSADCLPVSHIHYAKHLHEISDRLASGQRLHDDLVWLRALQCSFASGFFGETGQRAATLLRLAIDGAARPVIVYRAVLAPRDPSTATERAAGAPH